MNIIFRDHEGHELGRIAHQNIHEILIPAFKEDSHDMFIKRVFQEHPEVNTWQILEMVTDNLDVYLKLRPIASISSLKDFARGKNKQAEHFLRKFYLVEVDFGFYSDLFNVEGQRYKNTEHTHTLLSGELHKRRPCIVLDAHGQQVQVIPLSTKVSIQKNPKNILMTQLPPKAHVRYKEKPVTALINMIQTVSASRIYPLRSEQGKYEHKYASYKIGSDDQFSLNNALAEQYNSVIVTKLEQLELRLENINHERNKLLIKYKDLKRRVQNLSEVELMMLKLGKDLDLGTSIEEIMKNYGS